MSQAEAQQRGWVPCYLCKTTGEAIVYGLLRECPDCFAAGYYDPERPTEADYGCLGRWALGIIVLFLGPVYLLMWMGWIKPG